MNRIKGYVGLTDPDWSAYLARLPRVDEVNFWQPHGGRQFRALAQGEPFFFKSRGARRDIVGFGFFHRFESMPAWLAWECFGEMNGAPDFDSMVDRILRLRREPRSSDRSGDFEIGCIMIAAPVFFPEDEWVPPPRDWAKTGIQQGKRYPLSDGEGRRLLDECLARARGRMQRWNVEPMHSLVAEEADRYGPPIQVRPRLGQGIFRVDVRRAYSGGCAVTDEHSLPALEAAHIQPYAEGGVHRVENGLYLRRDVHRLFDHGYVTVTPDYEFRVGERLYEDFGNGRSYKALDGKPIRLPGDEALRPNREQLAWHQHMKFKG